MISVSCFSQYLKPKKKALHNTLKNLLVIDSISVSLQTLFAFLLFFELQVGRFTNRCFILIFPFISLVEVYEGIELLKPFKKVIFSINKSDNILLAKKLDEKFVWAIKVLVTFSLLFDFILISEVISGINNKKIFLSFVLTRVLSILVYIVIVTKYISYLPKAQILSLIENNKNLIKQNKFNEKSSNKQNQNMLLLLLAENTSL